MLDAKIYSCPNSLHLLTIHVFFSLSVRPVPCVQHIIMFVYYSCSQMPARQTVIQTVIYTAMQTFKNIRNKGIIWRKSQVYRHGQWVPGSQGQSTSAYKFAVLQHFLRSNGSFSVSRSQGQHCSKIVKPSQSLPLQMAEGLPIELSQTQ